MYPQPKYTHFVKESGFPSSLHCTHLLLALAFGLISLRRILFSHIFVFDITTSSCFTFPGDWTLGSITIGFLGECVCLPGDFLGRRLETSGAIRLLGPQVPVWSKSLLTRAWWMAVMKRMCDLLLGSTLRQQMKALTSAPSMIPQKHFCHHLWQWLTASML